MIYEVSQMTKEIIHYSEEELKKISNLELLQLIHNIQGHNTYWWLSCNLSKVNPNLYLELCNRTSLWNMFYQDKKVPIRARIYCIEHNVTEPPICQNPNCPTHNFVGWDDKRNRISKFCCSRCNSEDPSFRQRVIDGNMNKFGVKSSLLVQSVIEKSKATLMKNLGVDNPMKCKEIQEKAKHTNRVLYGGNSPTCSIEVYNKCKATMLKRHGVEHPLQSTEIMKKAKKTFLDRFGVDNPARSKELMKKARETCQHKWGVNYYQQSNDYTRKWKYTNPKYPDMEFATSWEFKVYDFLVEHNIQFKYQPAIAIPYYCEGTRHYYHPDFLVGDRIVEVKGDNFFRINETTGKEEMYMTWKGDLSDEEYEWRCKVMEAKHQCMLANNVVILRGKDIKNLNIEMFNQ